jgi:glycosyltransferase involved in cell wall biosynthesis
LNKGLLKKVLSLNVVALIANHFSSSFDMKTLPKGSCPTPLRVLRVSIAMCTCNGEKYLLQQIKSICNQTVLPFELVICDDKSTDKTLDLIRHLTTQAPFPVRIVTNPERLGSARNFEKAIRLCTGEIIALCDQDDVWYPEKLETLASMFSSDPALGGAFSDGDLTGPDGECLGVTLWQSFLFDPRAQDAMKRGSAEDVLLRRSVVTGTTLAFRSTLRDRLLPIPASWMHDGWLAWMLALNSKLGLCPKKLIAYRIHPSQQIGAPTGNASFLKSIVQEGCSQYLKRMRLKHTAEYEGTSQQFGDLGRYLEHSQSRSNAHLFRHSKAKARFSAAVANAIGTSRLFRFPRLLSQAANYFHYSARPVRLLIRDMIL